MKQIALKPSETLPFNLRFGAWEPDEGCGYGTTCMHAQIETRVRHT